MGWIVVSSIIRGHYVDGIIQNVRRSGERVFEQKPEDVARRVAESIERAGFAVRMFIKAKWSDVEAVLSDVEGVVKEVERRDPEVHAVLVKHIDWLNSFSKALIEELKKRLFGA